MATTHSSILRDRQTRTPAFHAQLNFLTQMGVGVGTKLGRRRRAEAGRRRRRGPLMLVVSRQGMYDIHDRRLSDDAAQTRDGGRAREARLYTMLEAEEAPPLIDAAFRITA